MEDLWRYGRKAYEALSRCVEEALEREDPETALICGLPLAKLAELEKASFWGYEGAYDYNTALDLAAEALKLVEREGVGSWLKRYVPELRELLKDMGVEVE